MSQKRRNFQEIDKWSTSYLSSRKEINLKSNHFLYCIFWTQISLITYLLLSIGRTGIGISSGIIHDFAGSFFVNMDDFAFGYIIRINWTGKI